MLVPLSLDSSKHNISAAHIQLMEMAMAAVGDSSYDGGQKAELRHQAC